MVRKIEKWKQGQVAEQKFFCAWNREPKVGKVILQSNGDERLTLSKKL
jgi:hypothetical protein